MARGKSSDNNKQVFWIILALVIAVLLFGGFLSKEQVAVEASHADLYSYEDEPSWTMKSPEELNVPEKIDQLTDNLEALKYLEEEMGSQCIVGEPSSPSSSFMSPCRALSYSYPNDTVETTYYGGPGCKPIVCYLKEKDQYYVYPTCTNGNPVTY